MSRADSISLRLFMAMLFLLGHQGCALFPDAGSAPSLQSRFKPIAEPRDQIELEVWYVDRPVGDPLIGEALWGGIDQISGIAVEDRVNLAVAGIRFGVTGSDRPRTLSALLSDREASTVQSTTHQQIHLMSDPNSNLQSPGATGQLEVANLPQSCRIRIPGQSSQETRDYSGVRCVFQVTAQRIQEGWVRLEFVPEIHHGHARIRPQATATEEWQWRESQQIEPLYQQRFSLQLNLGEHVVIGAVGDMADSVGQHFFCGGAADPDQERLIVIRVKGLGQVRPRSESDWSPRLSRK